MQNKIDQRCKEKMAIHSDYSFKSKAIFLQFKFWITI